MDPFYPEWQQTYQRQRGVLVDTSSFNYVDYFLLFFPNEAITLMTDMTNMYALQFFDNPDGPSHDF